MNELITQLNDLPADATWREVLAYIEDLRARLAWARSCLSRATPPGSTT